MQPVHWCTLLHGQHLDSRSSKGCSHCTVAGCHVIAPVRIVSSWPYMPPGQGIHIVTEESTGELPCSGGHHGFVAIFVPDGQQQGLNVNWISAGVE